MAQTLGNINFGNVPVAAPGGLQNANEGLTVNAGNVQLGGVFPAQGVISNNRLIEIPYGAGIVFGGAGLNDGGKIDIARTGIRIDSDIAPGGQFTNYYFNPAQFNINSTGTFAISFNSNQLLLQNNGGGGLLKSTGVLSFESGQFSFDSSAAGTGFLWFNLISGVNGGFSFYDLGGPSFDANELNLATNLSGCYLNFADKAWFGYNAAADSISLLNAATFSIPIHYDLFTENLNFLTVGTVSVTGQGGISYHVNSPGIHSFTVSATERFRVSGGVVLVNTALRVNGSNVLYFDVNGWRGGAVVAGAVTPDTTRYIELNINGVNYKVIVST